MIKKLIALSISILMAFNATAATKTQSVVMCEGIETLSVRYFMYGMVDLSALLDVIKNDSVVDQGLKDIIVDSYHQGKALGTKGLTDENKAAIGKNSNAECMAYFGY